MSHHWFLHTCHINTPYPLVGVSFHINMMAMVIISYFFDLPFKVLITSETEEGGTTLKDARTV